MTMFRKQAHAPAQRTLTLSESAWLTWARASRDRALTEDHPAATRYAHYLDSEIAQLEASR